MRPNKAPDLSQQLAHLAALAADDDTATEELPVCELLLRTGSVLSGSVFSYADNASVMIGLENGTGITTVLTSELVGLSLDNSDSIAQMFGTPTTSRGDAPTKLKLKRRVKALSDKTETALKNGFAIDVPWDDLPGSAEARGDLAELLEELDATLTDLRGDDLGVEALSIISSVRLRKSAKVGVELDGEALIINVRSRGDRIMGPGALRDEIEAVL